MAEFGFIALICQPNRDSVYVLQAPTLRKPPKYNGVEADSMSRSMVSLPYQLLASRIAAYLADQKSQLTSGKSPQEIETNFGEVLQELLAGTGHGSHVNVKLEKDPNPPRRDYITLDLRTGQDILNGASLYFSLPL